MVSTSKFELYIKKHIFTTFLLILGMGVFYGLYLSTIDNSLDFYYVKMKEYDQRLKKLKEKSVGIDEKFKELQEKIRVIGKFNYIIKCDNNIVKNDSIYSLVS